MLLQLKSMFIHIYFFNSHKRKNITYKKLCIKLYDMSIYIIGFHFTCTCTTTCEYAVLLGSKITVPFGSNLICKKKLFTHMFHFPTSPKSSLWVLALAASKQFKVHGISRAFFMLSFFIRTWIQDMVSKNNQKKKSRFV